MTELVQPASLGDVITYDDRELVIESSCEANFGVWYCVTHDETFAHNFAKDSHLGDDAAHVLAWLCAAHGPEVP